MAEDACSKEPAAPAVAVLSATSQTLLRQFQIGRSGESYLSLMSVEMCLSLSFILRKHLAKRGTLLSTARQTLKSRRHCFVQSQCGEAQHLRSDPAVHTQPENSGLKAQGISGGGRWQTAVQSLAARLSS